jgi:hypothetical protein
MQLVFACHMSHNKALCILILEKYNTFLIGNTDFRKGTVFLG